MQAVGGVVAAGDHLVEAVVVDVGHQEVLPTGVAIHVWRTGRAAGVALEEGPAAGGSFGPVEAGGKDGLASADHVGELLSGRQVAVHAARGGGLARARDGAPRPAVVNVKRAAPPAAVGFGLGVARVVVARGDLVDAVAPEARPAGCAVVIGDAGRVAAEQHVVGVARLHGGRSELGQGAAGAGPRARGGTDVGRAGELGAGARDHHQLVADHAIGVACADGEQAGHPAWQGVGGHGARGGAVGLELACGGVHEGDLGRAVAVQVRRGDGRGPLRRHQAARGGRVEVVHVNLAVGVEEGHFVDAVVIEVARGHPPRGILHNAGVAE